MIGTSGFHYGTENERVTAVSSRCRQNFKFENFRSSFGGLRQKVAPNMVAGRATRLFSAIRPITFLICDVVTVTVSPSGRQSRLSWEKEQKFEADC